MDVNDELYKEIMSYDKPIMKFDRDGENDFCPAHYQPKEEGTYVTIRCGLSGIYQTLNDWKDGKWMAQALDGSITIAYSRKTVTLKNWSKKDV